MLSLHIKSGTCKRFCCWMGQGELRKLDIATEVAVIDFLYWDDIIRQIAFEACETFPRDNPFCGEARKCIDRAFINIFWSRMVCMN